ncbi:MAG: flagellar filament capping protein FliD [Pirellulales bacterium]|nr:flagellar filament capping protein FliD [Pirellulales bacterium]
MASITASTGLISGIDYQKTIDQLIAIQARPQSLLKQLSKQTESEQTAVTNLAAMLLSLQFQARNLGKDTLYQQRTVSSSNSDILAATVTGQPAAGSYQFTPLQKAQRHQVLSSGVASATEGLGGGTFSFRFGGYLDGDTPLEVLGGGAGLSRGKIRITDRSGASAEIDLRYARTVDDVLRAVNDNAGVNVTLEADGDRLVLRDNTGQSASNLKVQEIGGQTAASLGLAGIDVAASQGQGQDIVRLFDGLGLGQLNSGNGVRFHDALPELQVSFRDGSAPLTIDFHKLGDPGALANGTTSATNGATAQVKISAKSAGTDLNGVTVAFQDDPFITQGNEQVSYDAQTKRLTFRIDAGHSTAADAVAALQENAVVGETFTAALPSGSNGAGLLTVDDSAVLAGGQASTPDGNEQTIGDVLATINAADPARLKAEIGPDGDRIVLTDLTSDNGGTFAVASLFNTQAAADLGLIGTAVGATLTGKRVFAGIKTTLLNDLNGTKGLGTLGQLSLTDRSGAAATVNLAGYDTLQQVIDAINGAGLGLRAQVSDARDGLTIVDTTGQSASHLIVANGDATNTAAKLGIAANAATSQIVGADLKRRVLSENTKLDSLRGGQGISRGLIKVFDTKGLSTTINLGRDDIQTVGDVIDAIDGAGLNIDVRINDEGDGLLLVDTGGGNNVLRVTDITGTGAADLRLTNAAKSTVIGNETKVAINATTTQTITLGASDSLDTLIAKINDLKAGVTATKFNDGSTTNPFRLSLTSQAFGAAGGLRVNAGGLGIGFTEAARAQDAVLLQGTYASGGVTTASTSNKFNDVLPGVSLTIVNESQATATISVNETTTSLAAGVTAFVDNYNKIVDAIGTLTAYNEQDKSAGILLGDGNALRVENDLGALLSRRFFGVGKFQSLQSLGLELDDKGKLVFNQAELESRFADDPDAVKEFFTADKLGFADKLEDLLNKLAGEGNSLLAGRLAALETKRLNYESRISDWDKRLEKRRDLLTKQFNNLEATLSKLQANISVVSQLASLASVSVSGSGSTRA